MESGQPEKKSSVLYPAKKDRHTIYRYSEQGKARDYRRYKKKLAVRILYKQQLIVKLMKELLDATEI